MSDIKAILFDLDGTLLPLDNDAFISEYFAAITAFSEPLGYPKREASAGLWQGTKAMVKNDGSRTCMEVFWQTFASFIPGRSYEQVLKDVPLFDAFYRGEGFAKCKKAASPNPEDAQRAVRAAADKGLRIVLATNPLFPRAAISQRLKWAGVDENLFQLITTYDNCRFSKPNPGYYADIAEKIGVEPRFCLMAGNDIEEDLIPADSCGMQTLLISSELHDTEKYPIKISQCRLSALADLIRTF